MSTTANPLHDAYNAFTSACDAWQAHLEAAFGSRAGDARYTKEGEGKPGTALHSAYLAFVNARDAWRAANHLPA